MAPQRPTSTPTPASGVQVVTLTVFSTGSAGSTGVPASSRGGSSVPIAAIAGGAAAGVTLAVAMVLIWKYWGLVIKRTERRKRKEAQEILTVRENTRRNAATRFKPQSSLHPILRFDPEGRRVKFLTRTPTLTRGKTGNDNTAAPAAIPPTVDSEKETVAQPEMRTAADPGPTDNNGPRQPSLRFAPAPAPRLVYEPWEPEPKSEGREQQPEPEAEEETNSHPPEPAPKPTPIPSTSHGPSGRSNSSAPITPTTPFRDTSNHPPSFRPSRSTRMRTPTRLPNPPDAPPIPARGALRHSARPSSSTPTPSGSQTPSVPPSRLPAISPRRPPSVLVTPPTSGPPIPPPSLAAAAAAAVGPSTTPSSSSSSASTSLPPPPPRPAVAISPPAWVGSSLQNSVLASDRPVIMPRAKRASQPGSPSSTLGQLPTLASSASHVSAADHSTETTGENARQTSPSSTPSAYSDD